MQLTPQNIDDAPDASRPLLEGIAADLGLVPNLAATAAASPALLAGFDGVRRAVASTTIDPVLREIVGLTTGVAVDNRYGVAFHSTMLAGLGLPDEEIAALRAGHPPSDEAYAAVHRLVLEIVLARGKVSDEALAAAQLAGLTDEAVLEVALESAFAGLVGLIDNLAGPVELDGFLVAQAWDGGAQTGSMSG